MLNLPARQTTVTRHTSETQISVALNLDGSGQARVATGIGFFDHLLHSLARHGSLDLDLHCEGDLQIDDHHSVEDCGLVLGQALDTGLGDRRGVQRFGVAYAPLDEALVRAVIDLSGRGGAWIHLPLTREMIGNLSCENIAHFFRSLAMTARMTLHLDTVRGENGHHLAEAAFKAVGLALRAAIRRSGDDSIPSTKGLL